MKIAPLPANENQRLAALKKYDILDTEPETAFETLVHLACYICQVPIAAIGLIDENRYWIKAISGVNVPEIPREITFCSHTILQDGTLVVPDTTQDDRFFDCPLVTMEPYARFYAGVPLTTSDGYRLGTLCVIDRIPRELNGEQQHALGVLADNVMANLELRLSHKLARQHIREQKLAAAIFNAASEALIVTDSDNRIISVNPAFTVMTGYTSDDVVGRNPNILSSGRQDKDFYQKMWQSLNATGHWDGELWDKRKNGELFAEYLSINVLYLDDGTKLHFAIFSDITEKKQANELIWKQANFDHLTHLPNRRLFQDRLEQEVKIGRRSGQLVALLFIDLDHFKEVNDSLGHDVGDQLLGQVADRINQCVREADTVARMGGDEFTVILLQINDPIYIGKVAENIIRKISQPFIIGTKELNISASIGIVTCPKDGDEAGQLLKKADVAMYSAKTAGRGCFRFFEAV